MKFSETLQDLNNQIVCAKFFTDTSFAFNYLDLKNEEPVHLSYVDKPYENILTDLFGSDYKKTDSLAIDISNKVNECLYEAKRLISNEISGKEYRIGKLIAQATEICNEDPFKFISVPQIAMNSELSLYVTTVALHKLLQHFIGNNENAINVPKPVYNFTDSLVKHHFEVISWTFTCYSEIYLSTFNLFNREHEEAWNQLYDSQID